MRNLLSKGNVTFSEESSCAVYEMGNMELIELNKTSATIQCPSCLRHVLNTCQCGVWLRPNQSTMSRVRTAFQEERKVVTTHGNKIIQKSWIRKEE